MSDQQPIEIQCVDQHPTQDLGFPDRLSTVMQMARDLYVDYLSEVDPQNRELRKEIWQRVHQEFEKMAVWVGKDPLLLMTPQFEDSSEAMEEFKHQDKNGAPY